MFSRFVTIPACDGQIDRQTESLYLRRTSAWLTHVKTKTQPLIEQSRVSPRRQSGGWEGIYRGPSPIPLTSLHALVRLLIHCAADEVIRHYLKHTRCGGSYKAYACSVVTWPHLVSRWKSDAAQRRTRTINMFQMMLMTKIWPMNTYGNRCRFAFVLDLLWIVEMTAICIYIHSVFSCIWTHFQCIFYKHVDDYDGVCEVFMRYCTVLRFCPRSLISCHCICAARLL